MTEKNKIEAVLFASGKKLSEDDIAKLAQIDKKQVKIILQGMKHEFEEKETALKLIEENDGWKLTIKEKYIPFIRNIQTETELSKSVMETLGVIAWKYPALQCDVIKIRTNKAYDHLDLLEEAGFISREKSGRTKKIKLTDKFFNYFDLPKNKQGLKEFVPDHVKQKMEKIESDIDSQEKVLEDEKVKKDLAKNKQQQIEKFGEEQLVVAKEEQKVELEDAPPKETVQEDQNDASKMPQV